MSKESPVAVLGSTPEFRDLLCDCGFRNVFVIDKNQEFHERMNHMRIFRNEEVFVCGDWIDVLGSYEAMFSLVLSDLTSGNVAYCDRARFYELIDGSLSRGGWFIDKVLTNERKLISIEHIEAYYADSPINLQSANRFSCEAIFCSELQLENEMIDTSEIYRRLEVRLPGRRFMALCELAKRVTPPGCRWYYGRPWGMLSGSYCPSLTLRRSFELPREGPYSGRAKQFIWQKC
ncbi:hypothetical protein [Rhodopseudomonas telluris]|uniref:Uncharacterized protein n=1 Tax=Rhodopseudomonas telluris TaxID=644215 RepID=A0ABV6EWL3_9BRAD